jgi:hypothetical protein
VHFLRICTINGLGGGQPQNQIEFIVDRDFVFAERRDGPKQPAWRMPRLICFSEPGVIRLTGMGELTEYDRASTRGLRPSPD